MSIKSHDCIVVIPTHKATMTSEEERSFRNTLDVLHDWDIALLLPSDVSQDNYDTIRLEDKSKFSIVTARSGWMGSIEKYNHMALSPEFYRTFKTYKYLLICHLDAWVFRDDLQRWIDKDYDYIGAPWFLGCEGSNAPLEKLMCPQGGNGGFSLRKVDKMIELTTKRKRKLNFELFVKGFKFLFKNRRYDLLKIYLRSCREVLQDVDAFQKKYNVYEDALISVFYSMLDKSLSVAPPEEAMYFATEVNSEEILNTKLGWTLPFAIHGYDKYLTSIEFLDKYRNDEHRNNYTKNLCAHYPDQYPQHENNPLITVVTATYNLVKSGRVETFRQCMESIHQQTYGNIEHVIIDGASSDGTLEILQEYIDKGWCVCYSEKDDGVWDAMYKGQQRAKGKFINYMNSDDYFCRPDAISVAVQALVTKKADWFFSDGTIIRGDGSSYPFPTSQYGVFHCMGILHQTMFVRTDILKAINPFRSNHITRENFLMMILCLNDIKCAYSKESLVCYREGGFSTEAYGNLNLSRTKNDFAKYFYDTIGRFWGMTEAECLSMFGWECFGINGVRYSYRLSKKLKHTGLRFAFIKSLTKFANNHKNIAKLVLKELVSFSWRR